MNYDDLISKAIKNDEIQNLLCGNTSDVNLDTSTSYGFFPHNRF